MTRRLLLPDEEPERAPVVDPDVPPPGTVYGIIFPIVKMPKGIAPFLFIETGWELKRN